MICLTPKPSQKISEITGDSLWSPSSLDLKPLNYVIFNCILNKTKATSHLNIGSLKTAIEKEWNKMSEEFILKPCKWFRRHIDTIIEKQTAAILSKFPVLYLSS